MNNAEYFTQEELTTISNALLQAIQNNNEAAKLTISPAVADAIGKSSAELMRLNTKVCNLMQEE